MSKTNENNFSYKQKKIGQESNPKKTKNGNRKK